MSNFHISTSGARGAAVNEAIDAINGSEDCRQKGALINALVSMTAHLTDDAYVAISVFGVNDDNGTSTGAVSFTTDKETADAAREALGALDLDAAHLSLADALEAARAEGYAAGKAEAVATPQALASSDPQGNQQQRTDAADAAAKAT